MFLPVGDTLLSDIIPPTNEQIDKLIKALMKFYVDDKYKKVSGLASRFALWNLPIELRDTPNVTTSFALWLSLVWIIDDLFDKDRVNNGIETKRIIERIVKGNGHEPLNSHEPLNNPLFELLDRGFNYYREIIGPKGPAYHKIQEWLLTYLDNLFGTEETLTLATYENWRMIDGAMMCVSWHLVHYLQDTTQDDLDSFKQAAVYVAYQNDLLSYQRDLNEGTPNLIRFMEGEGHWDKYQKAVEHVGRLWVDIENPITRSVILGSYNWAITEPRYTEGLKLLQSYLRGDKESFIIKESLTC